MILDAQQSSSVLRLSRTTLDAIMITEWLIERVHWDHSENNKLRAERVIADAAKRARLGGLQELLGGRTVKWKNVRERKWGRGKAWRVFWKPLLARREDSGREQLGASPATLYVNRPSPKVAPSGQSKRHAIPVIKHVEQDMDHRFVKTDFLKRHTGTR